ncbi:chitinase-like protein Idgf2 [Drosophila albomicans]|uniref:Chitinase-like protein Idgf2 n=1 Tax=Drosophila albomicans TaxID=7291 RepID=A0A9C6T1N0_DROAB|nr:chitinase-like protein Idgf2 [Drosophila albomicans]
MKVLALLLALPCIFGYVTKDEPNLVCFYNSESLLREDRGQLSNKVLELGLQFCSHLIYGYAGIRGATYEAYSLNENLDIKQHQFTEVTALKRKYPKLKVLLSVGGDRDPQNDRYIELLEGGKARQAGFIQSAFALVKNYGFDGLDLSYQFPRNKPRKVHSALGQFWKSIKKIGTGDFVVDPDANKHKDQFTTFARDIKDTLYPGGFLLSLTVLPNVNSSWYFDIPALNKIVDIVNLAAFDFLTPERNPEEADYTASLHNPEAQNRLNHYNVDFQAQYWLNRGFAPNKINLGVASYGNAWKLTSGSGTTGTPVVSDTEGPAPPGPYSRKAGLLSFAEVCSQLINPENHVKKDDQSALHRTAFGNYAFRPATGREAGIWISYDDLDTISHKTNYAKTNLGGVALFDLGYDDFGGLCSGDQYPVLRTIKYRLGAGSLVPGTNKTTSRNNRRH